MKKTYFCLLFLFAIVQVFSQTTYYSKSAATDFNDVATWSDTSDGTGASPASISSADNFIVANGSLLTLTSNASVRNLTISAGSLTISSNQLNVEIPSQRNASFVVNTGGSFIISNGNLNVNGNVYFADSSSFTQSGGIITVDGNDTGNAATSVPASLDIFAIGRNSTNPFIGTVNVTGGTIIIVDPHVHTAVGGGATNSGTTPGGNAFYYFGSAQVSFGVNHNLKFGDGVSTDAGGNAAYGFSHNIFPSGGRLLCGNIIIDAGIGTNRFVRPFYTGGVRGDLNIISGEFRMQTAFHIAGNVINNGLLTNTSTLTLGTFVNAIAGTSSSVQSISGSGQFSNSLTSATANTTSLTINNSNPAGVSISGYSSIIPQPSNSFSVSGTLTITNGRVAMDSNATFVVGIATPTAGTLNITNGGFVSGTTLARWWTNGGTGTATTAGTDPSTQAGRYPFLNAANEFRNAFLLRTTPSAGGLIAVTYNETAGTSNVSFLDDAYNVNLRTNDNWSVSALSGTPAAASHVLSLIAPNAFGFPIASPSNARIVRASSIVGTHQQGTTTPGAQRIISSFSDLTSEPFYLGINDSELLTDLPDYVSLQFPSNGTLDFGETLTVYGQVYEAGLTDVAPNIAGQAPGIQMWVGLSPLGQNTNPNTWTTWVPATWNSGHVSNNDEYQAQIGFALPSGTYYYATRFSLNGGNFVYGGIDSNGQGNFWNGTTYMSGVLTVNPLVNDECSGAVALTVNSDFSCTSMTQGTIAGATASPVDAAACGGTENDDVWFSFVATNTTHKIDLLNITGSTTDLYHSVWTGADCNSLTLVPGTCSDPNTSNPTGLVPGQTYYLRIYSWANAVHNSVFDVCIGTPPPPPANDECLNTVSLSVGQTVTSNLVSSTNLGATLSPDTPAPSCGSLNFTTTGKDVWYSVVIPASGNVIIETSAIIGGLTDSVMQVYSGTCGSLSAITCNDDIGGGNNLSRVTLTGRTPGEIVIVRVFGYNGTQGNYNISAYDCPSNTPAPTGDATQEFCNSATVADLEATGTAIKWYTTSAGGTALLATDALVDGQVYHASQTLTCESFARLAVTVTITNTAAPTGDATQDFCDDTLADLVVVGTNVIWYDLATGGNVLPDTTALVDGTTYYASQTVDGCESTSRLAVTVNEDCPLVGCLTGTLYPSATYTPATCDGVTSNTVAPDSWAGEYSNISVILGETYTFSSSVSTDFVTISDATGVTVLASGTQGLTWVSDLTGTIRFYLHTDSACGTQNVNRIKSIICGVASTDAPDYVSLQWPPVLNIAQGGSGTVYGQVYEAGLTDVAPNIVGQAPGITAWVGISPVGQNTNPNTWTTWVPATWNSGHVSNNDEYEATIGATLAPGTYYYATRFRLNTGPFVYGGIDSNNQGNFWDGTVYVSGVLTVNPPPAPANDLCSGAASLTVGVDFAANATAGTILGATTTSGLTPSCQSNSTFEVWYSVVVPSSGNLTIETRSATANGMTDSVVTVYTGACGTLTQIGCDDDGGNGFMSLLNLTGLTPGDVLYIAVWKFGAAAPTPTDSNFLVAAYDANLSVGGFDTSSFKYYPNPVSDVLNLSYSQTINEVTVFNFLGQQIITKQNNDLQAQVLMSDLPNGTYLVKVTTENGEHIVKVVKN
ncbi:T9SS type A sorting domain-containing protein [Flavobacterium orientale]|uniref:Por secretion system C-terminal sorting domain-containing protein n=1 Tax=Flavobacterium orientale TaxID=1756020 RepID=A0A916XWC9_9FLAO|nr:T9SS type A sorting domain-containing protein [Flavobacterium orientale]GGD16705.1 hypothetical protein GCM10011343_04460 [Flavobacterium orientale]